MIPKAIILAAGQGSRLSPLTDEAPKSLLKVNNKPIIEYIIERISSFELSEIIILKNPNSYKLALDQFLGSSYHDIPIKYIDNPIFYKTNSTYSLWLAKEFAGNHFLVINADTIFSRNIFHHIYNSKHSISLAIDDVLPLPDDAMRVKIVDGIIVDVGKNLEKNETDGDAIGIYNFREEGARLLFEELDRMISVGDVNGLFTVAVKNIMRKINVKPVSTMGLSWIEIDTAEDLKLAEEIVTKILMEENEND